MCLDQYLHRFPLKQYYLHVYRSVSNNFPFPTWLDPKHSVCFIFALDRCLRLLDVCVAIWLDPKHTVCFVFALDRCLRLLWQFDWIRNVCDHNIPYKCKKKEQSSAPNDITSRYQYTGQTGQAKSSQAMYDWQPIEPKDIACATTA
eukprot:577556_1